MNTKLMDRIFSAMENQETDILNQLESDIDVALEDGSLVTDEYDITRTNDGVVDILDKVNNEVTVAEVTPTGINLSNPISPADTEVQEIDKTAYAEEAGGQRVPEDDVAEDVKDSTEVEVADVNMFSDKVDKLWEQYEDLKVELEDLGPNVNPSIKREYQDKLKELEKKINSKSFAKLNKDSIIFRIGNSDFEVKFNKNKGGVVSNIDDERQHWEFDSKTPFDKVITDITEEVNGNKKGVKLLNRDFSSNNAGFNYRILQCTVNADNDRTEWQEIDSDLSYEDAQIKITNLRNQVDTSKYPYIDYKIMNQDIERNFSKMSEKVQKHFTKRHYEQHKDNMMDRNLKNLSPEVQKIVEDRIAKRSNPEVKNFSKTELAELRNSWKIVQNYLTELMDAKKMKTMERIDLENSIGTVDDWISSDFSVRNFSSDFKKLVISGDEAINESEVYTDENKFNQVIERLKGRKIPYKVYDLK